MGSTKTKRGRKGDEESVVRERLLLPPPRLASGRAGFQARIAGAGRVTASPSRFAGRPPVARAVPGAASGGARGDILLAFWIALPLGRGE